MNKEPVGIMALTKELYIYRKQPYRPLNPAKHRKNMISGKKIILASSSPRRQMILTEAGIDHIAKPVDITEEYYDHLHVDDVAKYLAEKKAKQFPYIKENEIIITADTTVVVNNTILGKPEDKEDARLMLTSLSGKSHHVITGVCIKSREKTISFDDTTYVVFKTLTDEEIDYYIDNYEPYDKAGAYGIQEWIGMIGVIKIEGSYFNVMGLPIHKLYAHLLRF